MTIGIIGMALTFLGLAYLAGATLLVTLRGGRGAADPPASHPRTDPSGFPVLPAPRGALHPRRPLRPRRPRRSRRLPIGTARTPARRGRTALR